MERLLFAFLACLGPLACAANPVDTAQLIARIDSQLTHREKWISAVLTDTSLMALHPLAGFREVIKKHAKPEHLRLAAPSEAGVSMHLECNVLDRNGDPAAGALVYLYQTDDRGWYSDTAAHISGTEGDRRHARLFGYLRTDVNGFFAIETIRPASYPGSDLPQHIHCEVFTTDGQVLVTELLFRDDPKMTPETSFWALQNGFFIAPNNGPAKRPWFTYKITLH